MFLVRQCTAYARRFRTRYVALCDLYAAFYFGFVGLEEALRAREETGGQGHPPSAGEYVLVCPETDPSNFHYSVLAFFKRAVDEWLTSME